MILGIVILAMLISGPMAIAALAAGYSVLTALAIYSGVGVLAALAGAALMVAGDRLRGLRTQAEQGRKANAAA